MKLGFKIKFKAARLYGNTFSITPGIHIEYKRYPYNSEGFAIVIYWLLWGTGVKYEPKS